MFVARTGGEEFALIVEGASEEATFAIADRIRLLIEQTPFVNSQTSAHYGSVTISMGICMASEAEGPEDLYSKGRPGALPLEGRRPQPRDAVLDAAGARGQELDALQEGLSATTAAVATRLFPCKLFCTIFSPEMEIRMLEPKADASTGGGSRRADRGGDPRRRPTRRQREVAFGGHRRFGSDGIAHAPQGFPARARDRSPSNSACCSCGFSARSTRSSAATRRSPGHGSRIPTWRSKRGRWKRS